jgi:hypothetical protein
MKRKEVEAGLESMKRDLLLLQQVELKMSL